MTNPDSKLNAIQIIHPPPLVAPAKKNQDPSFTGFLESTAQF